MSIDNNIYKHNTCYDVAVARFKRNNVRKIIYDLYAHFGSYTNIAKVCGVTPMYIRVRVGNDNISKKLSIKLEQATNGKFKARNLIGLK